MRNRKIRLGVKDRVDRKGVLSHRLFSFEPEEAYKKENPEKPNGNPGDSARQAINCLAMHPPWCKYRTYLFIMQIESIIIFISLLTALLS